MKNVFKKLKKGKPAVEMTCQRDKELMIAIYEAEGVYTTNFRPSEWAEYKFAMVTRLNPGIPTFCDRCINDEIGLNTIDFERFAKYWVKDKLRDMRMSEKIQRLA